MFSFDHTQLQDMGYILEPLAECVYRITWGESERILTCVDEQELQREEDKQRVFAAIPAIDV
ncbi:hypothetical protein M2G44_22975 [Vibrio vulnificus]|nr:hypothetical protein [Vibrio vulnificus]